ncbi:hypothetical protein PMPD1_0215 [Paramixta manurensis]|uniref:Fimbrial-type adhesion domain-containing protein n=1 Tax=Paramixta manurensis TaxID=2740817 RepID=A0A6M8U3B3_9GAMM|nr:hypothetical protein PMPD1_0215 [Erwiniaceae bacterium PD-1]
MSAKLNLTAILSVLMLGYTLPAAAAVTCDINGESGGANPTVSIQGAPNISATEDLPNGTVLFQGRLAANTDIQRTPVVSCYIPDTSATASETVTVETRGKVAGGALVGTDNYTFKTNVPGIGVRFWILGHYLTNSDAPLDNSLAHYQAQITVKPGGKDVTTTGLYYEHFRNLTFQLVKIGSVTPGMVNGISFPTVEYRAYPADGQSIGKLPARYLIANFSGSANISTPTCTTPSTVNVDLGTFTTTQIESATTTPWKDASIKLTNCQKFTGYQNRDSMFVQDQISGAYDVGMTTPAPTVNNVLGIKLNSNQQNIDVNQGIVGIKTGGGEAQGVAVQIAKGNTASNTPAPLGVEFNQTLALDGSPTINIPLVVRMIKQGTVKAGRVNAQITYTISYK